MPQRSILVADDIENETDSGRRRSHLIRSVASSLAQRLKTGIDLLYVEDIKAYPPDRSVSPRIRARHAKNQERLEEASRQFQISIRYSLKSASPAEQILKALRSPSSPELVVVGTQGRKGLRRLLIGSVAEEVIRHSRRPVMVIGPVAQEKGRDFTDRKQLKILVATDLGKNSRAAEQYALSLAKRIGAHVVLFHCLWDSINAMLVNSAFSGLVAINLDAIIAETRNDAVESMKQKVDFYRKHGVPCEYKIEEKAIVSACGVYQEGESGYSLVIMGTRGKNALLNAFFGSTARETILKAPVPVITVHS